MATEYNSKLIDDLYQTRSADDAVRVLDEINEIGDPVFVYPIYAAYKRFSSSSSSHFFIDALDVIESREVLTIIVEIVSNPDISSVDFTFALPIFLKYGYFAPDIVKKARFILYQFSVNNQEIVYLEALLRYSDKAGIVSSLSDQLMTIFESDQHDADDRTLALSYLLNSDPKKWLQFFVDNYGKIKNKRAEILLSKVLMAWKGPLTEKLKDKIVNEGVSRAREIIESSRKKQIEEKESSERKEAASYSNGGLITKIVESREKINLIMATDRRIGFNVFPQNETIYKQLEAATNEGVLKSCCVEFREFIQDMNKKISEHGISFEEASKIIQGLQSQDFNKSINSFHLFLCSRGINMDSDLCGLKIVNRLVNLWMHPARKEELTALLRTLKMFELYKKEDWVSLHRKILELYLNFLEGFYVKLVSYLETQKS